MKKMAVLFLIAFGISGCAAIKNMNEANALIADLRVVINAQDGGLQTITLCEKDGDIRTDLLHAVHLMGWKEQDKPDAQGCFTLVRK